MFVRTSRFVELRAQVTAATEALAALRAEMARLETDLAGAREQDRARLEAALTQAHDRDEATASRLQDHQDRLGGSDERLERLERAADSDGSRSENRARELERLKLSLLRLEKEYSGQADEQRKTALALAERVELLRAKAANPG